MILGFPFPIFLAIFLNELRSNKIKKAAQTLLYVTVRLKKKSKWLSDSYDIRPGEGEGIISGRIYGLFARGIRNLECIDLRVEIDDSMKDVAKEKKC